MIGLRVAGLRIARLRAGLHCSPFFALGSRV